MNDDWNAGERRWAADAILQLRREAARSADTHLLHMRFAGFPGIDFYFKDEAAHPTGSLKHRLARSLFLYALCNGRLREGQAVEMASDDGGPQPGLKAVVGRLAPEIDPEIRTREVRVYLEGARHILLPGSLVSARIKGVLGQDMQPADPADSSTWGRFTLVPKAAVLSTGVRHLAWRVAERGERGQLRFDPVPLVLGPRLEDSNGNDLYVVQAGLKPGDEVATQAAFLIDSQAQLAGTPSLIYPDGAPAPAHQH